jgi:hypothetical protein
VDSQLSRRTRIGVGCSEFENEPCSFTNKQARTIEDNSDRILHLARANLIVEGERASLLREVGYLLLAIGNTGSKAAP